ncbi:MAG: hypothetical protein LBH58_10765 [Tannerellaceae bacterium]|jgi:hypothetical protein|nr:hypothetical protein [Tannerellaceae bacterium]
METKITKTLVALCCMLFCITTYAGTTESNSDKLKGSWIYSLPEAPYEYQDGKIDFKETDGKLHATATIGHSTYEINNVKKEGNTYKCSLLVDGSNIDVALKLEGGELKGTVTADGWEMPVTFKRDKK